MKILSIVLCLGLYGLLPISATRTCYHWFKPYVLHLNNALKGIANSWIAVSITLLIPVLILALIMGILNHILFGLLSFILATFVLFYSFGEGNIFNEVSYFQSALVANEESRALTLAQHLLQDDTINDLETANHDLSYRLLTLVNERLLGTIFWFVIFGAYGALLYCFIQLFPCLDDNQAHQNSYHRLWLICNWIPARITAFTFTLMGHFNASFHCWLQQVFSSYEKNDTIILETGKAALHLAQDNEGQEALQHSLNLITRSVTSWGIVVFVVGILAWLI